MKNKLILLLLLLTSCNNIPFKNKNDLWVKIPVVEMKLNNKNYLFIIDSGASMSIIDSSFYNDNQSLFEVKDEVELIFTGISSQREVKAIVVCTTLESDKTLFVVSSITPIIQSLETHGYNVIGILGSDYFSGNNKIIDYKNKTLR